MARLDDTPRLPIPVSIRENAAASSRCHGRHPSTLRLAIQSKVVAKYPGIRPVRGTFAAASFVFAQGQLSSGVP
jgi:hypothetical protein